MSDEQTETVESATQVTGFVEPVQKLVDSILLVAKDADKCFREGNKSAGRRARKSLGEAKNAITPLRKEILAKMKGEGDE